MKYSVTKLLFIFFILFYFSGAFPFIKSPGLNSFSNLLADKNNNYYEKSNFSANNDTAKISVPEQKSTVINVLANDSGNNLRITNIKKPNNGSAWLSGSWNNPTITYQPNWNFLGTDSFEYTIKQNGKGQSKKATVTVTIEGPTPPVANSNTATTDVRKKVTIPVLENDTGHKIEFDWNYPLSPSHGEAWTSGNNIVYEPSWNYAGGTDTFTYRIRDYYGRTSQATITVDVTEVKPPVAKDDTATTELQKQVSIPVLTNDTGYEIEFDWDHPLSPSHGEAWTSGNNIIYEPSRGYEGGTDSFKYAIQDSFGRAAEATITVNVKPKPPVLKDDKATTTSGKPVTISVLSNDEGTSLAISSISSPSHGKAEISKDNIIYTPNDNWTGTDTFTYTVQDSAGQEETGNVSVEVTALQTQGMSISSGPIRSNKNHSKIDGIKIKYLYPGNYNAKTVIIRPLEKNKIITLDNIPYILIKNKTYTITAKTGKIKLSLSCKTHGHRLIQFISGNVSVSPMPGAIADISAENDIYELEKENTWYNLSVLDNDTGEGKLKIKSIDSGPEHGKARIDKKTQLKYKYNKNYTGIDYLTYTVQDELDRTANAEVTIYCGVQKINAVNDSASTESGSPVTIPVLQNDSGESISIKSVDTPTNGNAEISGEKIIYTPPQNFTGTVTFSYTIKDEYDIESSANITVDVSSGGGGGETGPLRQAIYKAVVDGLNDIDVDFEADSYDDASALPPIKLLLYKEVFDDLTNVNNDIYIEPDLEVDDADRIWLQQNIRDKVSSLYEIRMDMEDGTDTEAAQKINEFNNEKSTLINNLNTWKDNHPDDSGYDDNNY